MMRVLLSLLICSVASGFITTTRRPSIITKTLQQIIPQHTSFSTTHLSISTDDQTTNESSLPSTTPTQPVVSKAPDLNGKIVLPIKIANSGLKGYTGNVAAVYAILDSSYKRGSGDGWEHVKHVSITRNLSTDISYFQSIKSKDDISYIRALSFSYPQKSTMEDFANSWRAKVVDAGGMLENGIGWGMVPSDYDDKEDTPMADNVKIVGDEYEFDDEDEDDMDEDDMDDYLQMMAESRAATSSTPPPPAPLFVDNTGLSSIESLAPPKDPNAKEEEEEVISPFDASVDKAIQSVTSLTDDDGEALELNPSNVDKVLDEVRPYLISDGGNVSVQNVDVTTGNVYLLLEGACGSCASSTVTMKMGIERVLKEKFGMKLGEVIQVDPDEDTEGGTPTELTLEAVQAEVNRISTAIVAMGGVVRVVNVDPVGEVEIDFRGPNRVKKGLELALLDVDFVKHVKFVS